VPEGAPARGSPFADVLARVLKGREKT